MMPLEQTLIGIAALATGALVNARDGGAAWRLRCEVRERLIAFLQRDYPEALPRFRTELLDQRAEAQSD